MVHNTSVINQKGGVGKTTTTTNLAYGLSRLKETKGVLVVDCDPQGNASQTLGTKSQYEQDVTINDLLGNADLGVLDCVVETKYDKIDLIANNLDASSKTSLMDVNDPMRTVGLKFKISMDETVADKYDYVIFDCPPGVDSPFFANALTASDSYIIPIEGESAYALSGVTGLLKTVKKITSNINPGLQLLGALLTMFDSRTNAAKAIAASVVEYFGRENVFQTRITRNTSISQANMANQCICEYDYKATGCECYRKLAKEVASRVKAIQG